MKRILIADASKASLVMTSEVFKDHFPGVQVVVARTSSDAIELAKTAGDLDAFIIDYDLPDRDGAYTAARLKKMFTQPILITAFDRPDVHESIDRDLSAFDDCLSWLKKPVKPELVVSLAQRFIEGKHRCQRRLSCSIPAFLEIDFNPAALLPRNVNVKSMQVAKAKAVSKSKKPATKPTAKSKPAQKKSAQQPGKGQNKTAAKTEPRVAVKTAVKTAVKAQPAAKKLNVKPSASSKVAATTKTASKPAPKAITKTQTQTKKVAAAPLQPIRTVIPVTIDDVSLGGAKIRIHNQDLMLPVAGKGGGMVMVDLCEGQVLQVHVPPQNIVDAGADALDKWRKAQSKELAAAMIKKNLDNKATVSKSATMNRLAERTRSVLTKAETTEEVDASSKPIPAVLKGEIRWVAASEIFTFCGLRSETINVSKRLFESMIECEARGRTQLSPMVSPNIPRTPKLNA